MESQFFENLRYFYKILQDNKEGVFVFNFAEGTFEFSAARGDIWNVKEENFEKVFALFNQEVLAFKEQRMQNYSLLSSDFRLFLWHKLDTINEEIFFKEFATDKFIRSTPYVLHKIGREISSKKDIRLADLFIAHTFFGKENKTFSDFFQVYHYKSEDLLKKIALGLFLIGQVTILNNENKKENKGEVPKVKSLDLEKLASKLSSMQKIRV